MSCTVKHLTGSESTVCSEVESNRVLPNWSKSENKIEDLGKYWTIEVKKIRSTIYFMPIYPPVISVLMTTYVSSQWLQCSGTIECEYVNEQGFSLLKTKRR